jgi:hypothetical protein
MRKRTAAFGPPFSFVARMAASGAKHRTVRRRKSRHDLLRTSHAADVTLKLARLLHAGQAVREGGSEGSSQPKKRSVWDEID